MSKSFYHPTEGHWNTIGDVSQDIIDSYPAGTVEISLRPEGAYDWDGTNWLATPAPTTADVLAAWRETVQCSPFQGRVTLGAVEVARFEAILADDSVFTALGMDATQIWVLREAVKETIVWRRNSQSMATFAFLMGYSATQMDTLFTAAVLVDA
jgi:hypothetical protein